MIQSRLICAVVLTGLALAPAVAADRPLHQRAYVKAAPVMVETWGPAPYYVVDQGPEYSGPGIMIVAFRIKNTDLRQPYPYVSGHSHHPHFVATTDYYGVLPATLDPAARIPPHVVYSKKPRRKPVRARH
jgi:hypothetical protein